MIFPHRKRTRLKGNELRVVPSVQNRIIHKWLKETENKFDIKIDKYVIMPNHIHLIAIITERHTGRSLLWQKSFHDNIIRNREGCRKIWEYIDTNPLHWEEDCFYK